MTAERKKPLETFYRIRHDNGHCASGEYSTFKEAMERYCYLASAGNMDGWRVVKVTVEEA